VLTVQRVENRDAVVISVSTQNAVGYRPAREDAAPRVAPEILRYCAYTRDIELRRESLPASRCHTQGRTNDHRRDGQLP